MYGIRSMALLALMLTAAVARTADDPAAGVLAAVRAGDHAALTDLLAQGASPEARDADDYDATALMLAAEKDDSTSIRLLLAAGADVDAPDENGDSVRSVAEKYDITAVLTALGR